MAAREQIEEKGREEGDTPFGVISPIDLALLTRFLPLKPFKNAHLRSHEALGVIYTNHNSL